MLVVILGLIGTVLVAGAAIGGWFWWKSTQASPRVVATTIAPPVAAVPPPVQVTPPPAETPPAEPPPVETAPPAAPASTKAKRTPKPQAEKPPPVIIPPPPVAPAPPAPTPVAAPPAPTPTPKPAPPKPVITTPVMVSDALPFVINLAEDVPADASEGQAVRFTVGENLQVGDKIVIAKGATVTGAVFGEAGKKKFLGIGGHKLTFRLTQAEAVDGRKIAIRALPGKNQDGPATRSFETAKSSKPKGFAAMQGTVYIGYIDGDQMVGVRK
jgi:hypothetical protein